MQTIDIKRLFEELEQISMQILNSYGPSFNRLSSILQLIDSNAIGQANDEQVDNSSGHQYIEMIKILDECLTTNQIKPQKIQVQVKKQKNQSDTDSLSLVSEQKQVVNLMDSLYWFQLLGKSEKIFQPKLYNINYVKIKKFDENYQFVEFSTLYVDKGQNTVIYSGMNLEDNSPIAIKETLVTKDYLEQAQQYVIHSEIYDLYPNIFLKILLPVYINSITPERLKFVYSMERGEINLFQYSQQNKINDDEHQMIFQQLYNQVMLLHHHKIAHRDIKPQNIIFVKNKGWLLCDFEEALKYEKPSQIYSIRGTFGFIPPTIYQASNVGDVLMTSMPLAQLCFEIDDYLHKQQDDMVQKLIQNSLQYNRIETNICYVEPNLNKQKSINSQFMIYKENFKIIGRVSLDKALPFIQQINCSLDYYMIQNDINEILNIYQEICYYPVYIKQFKNIPNLKTFRSIRFWKQKFKTKDNIVKLGSIGLMAQLGFIDLVLQFGQQYLNNQYNFSIHMVVILILVLLQEKERALNEFQQLLKFREQQYMVDIEFRLFIKTLFSILDIRYIDQYKKEYKQFQIIQKFQIDLSKIQINQEDSDEVICQSFMNECISKIQFWRDQSMTLIFKNQIIDSYRLSLNDKLNDEINKLHKYFSTAFHYQESLNESIINKTYLSNNNQIRRIRKQMNYLLVHNSESKHQYQINNLLKQSAMLFNKQISKIKRQRAFVKLSIILLKFSQLPYQFYKKFFLKEIHSIIYEQLLDLDVSILKLVILSTNLIDQGLKICEQIKIKLLMQRLLIVLIRIKNYRRVKNLNNQEITLNTDHMKFQNLLLKGKIKQIRILRKKYKVLQQEFLFDQYLHREY